MELKKNPKHNLDQKRPLFFFIGLLVAILAIISAFEWKSEYEPIDLSYTEIIEEPIFYVQQTIQKKPEPPKPKVKKQVAAKAPSTKIVEIDNTLLEKFQEELFTPNDIIEDIVAPTIPVEAVTEFNGLVESPAEYPGGWTAFNKYIAQNIRFPRSAVNVGVDGKVFVQFTINKDGSISDIQIIRGLGMGCDSEALRVLQTIPKKFTPAKNRVAKVPVKMILP
ncbi:unnamed protein product, partial [Chrysoparadoxa australica]